MKKLAIISSYDELCGNAIYTKALEKEFAKHYDVRALKLNTSLLRKPELHALGNRHLQELAKELASYDYVNIQFEAGLFGIKPQKILERFEIIADASKNLIVTLHRCDLKTKLITKKFMAKCLKFRLISALHLLKSARNINNYAKLYSDIVQYCKKNQASIIVHTKRDKKIIQEAFDFNNVHDHPLTFLAQEELEIHRKNVSREKFIKKFHLNKNDIVIGMFGFISPHKGYITAIKAMKHLPDNYKLLIFGIQHPLSIVPHEEVNNYLGHVMSHIEIDYYNKQKIKNPAPTLVDRIKFCGGLNDNDFLDALLCCDMTVLPYLEVNQGGSGVASLVLDSGVPAIFSQTFAFLELEKYAKGAFKMFSIGNHLELATAIQCYDHAEFSAGLERFLKQYNMQTNIGLHMQIFNDQEKERVNRK